MCEKCKGEGLADEVYLKKRKKVKRCELCLYLIHRIDVGDMCFFKTSSQLPSAEALFFDTLSRTTKIGIRKKTYP